jgi:hypothetical protein
MIQVLRPTLTFLCRRTISECGFPSLSQGPYTVSSCYPSFSAWRADQGSLCKRPTKSGWRLPSGVGTSIRQLDQKIFPSRLHRLTNSLSGTPQSFPRRRYLGPQRLKLLQITTQHTIVPFIQYLEFFLTHWHIIPHLYFSNTP